MTTHWPGAREVGALVNYMLTESVDQFEIIIVDTDLPAVKNVIVKARPRGKELAVAQGLYSPDPAPQASEIAAFEEAIL